MNIPLPDTLLAQYDVLATLSEREGLTSLLAVKHGSDTKYVLKCSRDSLREEKDILERAAGQGIPAVIKYEQGPWGSVLIREYIEGETLLDYVQRKGSLSAEETAEIGIALCGMLERIHALRPPVIHRDIKAENIIRGPDGAVTLIDFGIARVWSSSAQSDTTVMGTPRIAPPEQFGFRQTDPRSDLYALGILLFELSSGEEAFDIVKCPASLQYAVRKATAFDPEKRFQSAAQMKRALKQSSKKSRRHRWAAAALACAVALLLLLIPQLPSAPEHYVFQDPGMERAVCRLLGRKSGSVTREDLAGITALLVAGDTVFSRWEDLIITCDTILLSGAGVVEERGDIRDLSDLRNMPGLRELSLCRQDISDLSPLTGLSLQRLAVHGNRISDLSPLSNMNLQELYAGGNPISDLRPMLTMERLWHLNLGVTDIQDLGDMAGHAALTRLNITECAKLEDLSALTGFPRLTGLLIGPTEARLLRQIVPLTELRELVLIGWDQIRDLSLLSGMHALNNLYVNMWELDTLSGIEQLTSLETLTVLCSQNPDTSVLSGLPALQFAEINGTVVLDRR